MDAAAHQWGRAILDEDIQALLYRERSVEDDQSEAERKHIITRPHFEKVADSSLQIEEVSWLALRYTRQA